MKGMMGALLWGIGVWGFPFAIGMAIFPIASPSTALFDTLVTLALGLAAAVAANRYLKPKAHPGLWGGLKIGFVWLALALTLDAPIFLLGPSQMRMSAADYAADIGLAYLLVPIIAASIGAALARANAPTQSS